MRLNHSNNLHLRSALIFLAIFQVYQSIFSIKSRPTFLWRNKNLEFMLLIYYIFQGYCGIIMKTRFISKSIWIIMQGRVCYNCKDYFHSTRDLVTILSRSILNDKKIILSRYKDLIYLPDGIGRRLFFQDKIGGHRLTYQIPSYALCKPRKEMNTHGIHRQHHLIITPCWVRRFDNWFVFS